MLLRKLLISLSVFLLTGGVAYAQESVTLAWDAPTHRIQNGDCNQIGTPLTQAEVASLEYTLSFRPNGSTNPWTNVDVTEPTATVLLQGYSIEYIFSVGARLPGGEIVCVSDPVFHTTGPDTNPPGSCTNLRVQ
jgi:hypothetical protein